MWKLGKLFFLLTIFFSFFGTVAAAPFNFVVNQGLWLSQKEAFAGDTVKVYTVVVNNNFSTLSATVNFLSNGNSIGKSRLENIKFEEARQAWVEYTLPEGDIKMEVVLENVTAKDSQGKNVAISSDELAAFGATQDFFVDIDTDNDGEGNQKDTDDDNDGLSDEEEKVRGSDPLKKDTDADGLSDQDEVKKGLDPAKADTDSDGYGDKDDLFPLNKDEWADVDTDGIGDNADPDDDNDGLSDSEEKVLGTNPNKVDTDDDTLSDGDEGKQGTNPLKKDTDDDGIDDALEIAGKTNPAKSDSDDDGLLDKDESTHQTNPLVSDTDGDGLLDGEEVSKKTNPLKNDTDGDGVLDKDDFFPLDASESLDADGDGIGNNKDQDDDNDGLTDDEEVGYGTSPLLGDTDADEVSDHEEIRKGTDPNKADTSWFSFLKKKDKNTEGEIVASSTPKPDWVEGSPWKRFVQFAALGSFILFLFFVGKYRLNKNRNYEENSKDE
jgi:hypothetical protein